MNNPFVQTLGYKTGAVPTPLQMNRVKHKSKENKTEKELIKSNQKQKWIKDKENQRGGAEQVRKKTKYS